MPPFPEESDLPAETLRDYLEGRPGSVARLLAALFDLFRPAVTSCDLLSDAIGALFLRIARGAPPVMRPVRMLTRIIVRMRFSARRRLREQARAQTAEARERRRAKVARDVLCDLIAKEDQRLIDRAIEGLTASERFVFLARCENAHYAEIAALMGGAISSRAVESRLRKLAMVAKSKLQGALSGLNQPTADSRQPTADSRDLPENRKCRSSWNKTQSRAT